MDSISKTRKFLNVSINYLYIIIPMFLISVIMLVPFFQNIYYSFTKWDGSKAPVFVGFKNYRFLLENVHFKAAISHNALIALAAPLWVIVPLILAVLLFQNPGWLFKTARMSILIPFAISMTVIGTMFNSFLHLTGPINSFLGSVGLEFLKVDWLGNSKTALIAVILTSFWKDFGFIVVIYLAGLSNLNLEILDSAKVDGANWFQEFRYVIIPQLNPIIVFITSLVLIGDFKSMFDYIYNMTRGGPGFATETIEFLLYNEAFRFYNMGFACALGIIIFIIIIIITFGQIKVMTRKD